MMYWDDMRCKYGFSDGETVPFGASEFRKVYITFINERAKRHRSKLRCFAYNRPGVHNYCMISIAPASLLKGVDPLDTDKVVALLPTLRDAPEQDKGFSKALEEAMGAGLDNYVEETTVAKLDELHDLLVNMDG